MKLHLGKRVSAGELTGFDEVVLATGVVPRVPSLPGIDHPKVLSYVDVVRHGKPVGERVAVIGAGGIGVDVSEFLTHTGSPALDLDAWMAEWGVTDPERAVGGLAKPKPEPSPRQVFLLQRKKSGIGSGLGKTSGWVHRAALKAKRVEQLTGVTYDRIDDAGLHLTVDGAPRLLEVDTVVVCAGQEPVRDLADELRAAGPAGAPDRRGRRRRRTRRETRDRPGNAARRRAVAREASGTGRMGPCETYA